jgi:hypothetical protein
MDGRGWEQWRRHQCHLCRESYEMLPPRRVLCLQIHVRPAIVAPLGRPTLLVSVLNLVEFDPFCLGGGESADLSDLRLLLC